MHDYESKDFPVHIDLGKEPDESMALPTSNEKRPKKYYPTLYVSDVKGLADLPKKGWALIEYDRSDLSLRTTDDGDRVSAELKIKTLCLPDEQEEGEDMATALARALKASGRDDVEMDDDEEGEED